MNFTSCTDATFPQNRNLEPPLGIRQNEKPDSSRRTFRYGPSCGISFGLFVRERIGSRDPRSKKKTGADVTKSLELFSEADRIARQYQRLLKTAESIKHQDTIKPKRILKVSLPANIDRSAYLNAFSNFERKHSGLRVEVLIDAGEDGLLNGAADVAYFGYRPTKEGITWIPAGHNVTFLMASRSYLRRNGTPQSVQELRNHTLLLRNSSNRSFSRRLENRDAVFEIESDEKVHFEDAYSCRTHLIAGEGISVDLVPSFVADELMRGDIVPVLPGWHRRPWEICVCRRDSDHSPLVSEMADLIVENFKKHTVDSWMFWYRYFSIPLESVVLPAVD